MKSIMVSVIGLLGLSGCAATTHNPYEKCSHFVSFSEQAPLYTSTGAAVGGLGLAMIGSGTFEEVVVGGALGAATGLLTSGGVQTHYVCPQSLTEMTEMYTK